MTHDPASTIEMAAISDLGFMGDNPNIHSDAQIESLARSIRTWGMPLPILIDDRSVVLAGNGTLAAAIKAGLTHVPVCRATGWTDAKKREYAVLDNKLRRMSQWDQASLRSEIQEIVSSEFLDAIGFSDEEIDKIISETSSFTGGADSSRTGAKVSVLKFGKEKVRVAVDERTALLSAVENYNLKNGTTTGFVENLLLEISKKYLEL
jgi:hypothetical protein